MRRGVLNSLILVFLFFYSCGQKSPEAQNRPNPKVRVKTALVQRMDMVDTVRFFGQTALRNEIFLASQFDGRLSDFHLFLGDAVHKDQTIGQIIPAKREALLRILPRVDAKMRTMLEDQMRAIPLSSPLTGTVLKVFLHNGDVVQRGQPIVHIGNLDILDVLGDLPVAALPQAQKQSTVAVRFVELPRRQIHLPVAAIGGQVDRATQTVPLRLTLKNPNHLFRPGMQVVLSFPGTIHKNALTIPRSALLEEEGIYSAFTIKNGRASKHILKIGIKQSHYVEVLSGLKEGDQVVTRKAYSLVDGMEVIAE